MSVGTLAEGRRRSHLSGRHRTHTRSVGSPLLPIAALTVLAAALRFTRLGHQGFWFDEGNTALLVHLSPGKMLGLIPQSESTPPLYYMLTWVWARVFGYDEAGLRSLSALAGVATVPVAYAAARELISERVGVVAAALTTCSPLLIWYSQEARSYALLVLLSMVALLAFAHARARPTPGTLTAWVLASALALATHYYAVLAIAPMAMWLLAAQWHRRAVQVAIGVVTLCGLALIPLAIGQSGTGNQSWIAAIPLGARLGQIIPLGVIGTGSPAYDVLEPLAAAMVVVGLVLLAIRSDPGERTVALLVGALALSGLVLSLLLVAVGVDDLIARNLLALWPFAAIAVAAGFGARYAGLVGVAAAAVLCATGIAAAIGVSSERNLQRPDWRAVARVLGPSPTASASGGGAAKAGQARAILVQHYRDLLPLSLYLPGIHRWNGSRPVKVSELDVVAISAPQERLCWWGAACNLLPSDAQRSYPIRGLHETSRQEADQFTIVRLVARRPVSLTPGAVARALTATTLPRDVLMLQG